MLRLINKTYLIVNMNPITNTPSVLKKKKSLIEMMGQLYIDEKLFDPGYEREIKKRKIFVKEIINLTDDMPLLSKSKTKSVNENISVCSNFKIICI